MPQIQSIREQYRKGSSVAEISRIFGVDPKTVRKYVKQEDFSPKPPERTVKKSILDSFKPLIDAWLSEDQGRWHKQRHTAKRIHDRLTAELLAMLVPTIPSNDMLKGYSRNGARPVQAWN
jgi:transposase